ncbi:MAG: AraC family transcriptional regulator [Pseudomonadota bacterium]
MIQAETDDLVPSYWVLGALRSIGDVAVARQTLLDAELTVDALTQEGAMIMRRQEVVFMTAAAKNLENPLFGVQAGLQIDPRKTSLLSYLVLNAAVLGDGLKNLARYLRLVRAHASVHLEERGQAIALVIETDDPLAQLNRQHSEFAIGATIAAFRVATGRFVAPLEIHFSHPVHAQAEGVEEAFACPVIFGQKRSEIVLDQVDLDLPLVDPDSRLLKILIDHAEALLARPKHAPDSYRSRVERLIVARLQEGAPTIEELAEEFGVGARTLSRRLEDEGCHLRELLDHLRFELAQAYLMESGISLSEIALLLGYADQSAFATAFKRWSGTTPRAWRTANRG